MLTAPRQRAADKTTKNTRKRTSIFPASVAADLSDHVERVRKEGGDADAMTNELTATW